MTPLILCRSLAIIAAILLVAAFALAAMEPPDVSLGSLLSNLEPGLLNALQAGVQQNLPPWFWNSLVVPVLVRPAWLLPAAGGLIFGGGAASLAFGVGSRSPGRWRG
ncbi:MAG: hypothetical protein ACREFU_07975 [Acetobacteraceae bacterium]